MMPSFPLLGGDFEDLGFAMMLPNKSNAQRCNERTRLERFKSWFGTPPDIVAIVWAGLALTGWLRFTHNPKPEHLLWSLVFLKTYSTEPTLASRVGGVDEKTFRKWAWFYVEGIAGLASKTVSTFAFFLLILSCFFF